MIEVRDLTKTYGRTRSLQGVSFDVEKGAILGFLGPNGAGKTTTMRILTGLSRPTAGRARVGGFDVVKDHQRVRAITGYLPEDSPAYPEMRAEEFLRFMAAMRDVPANRVNAEVDRVLEETAMDYARRRLVGNMSKGMRQRIGLAQALLGDPEVLVLDEPTVGLDPKQISDILNLIGRMRGERTVIFSTHILPNVQAVCSHVVILSAGKIISQGAVGEIGHGSATRRLRVKTTAAPEKLDELLKRAAGNSAKWSAETREYGSSAELEIKGNAELRGPVARAVIESGAELLELYEPEASLEEVYLRATSGAAAFREDER